ncbi:MULTISPECIES: hypothetical protein [Streptomyces]|uniref:hypothetical protein n=1 Tax=Streptomyces TaxID=1883 RepID=UPI001238DB1C|nr:hypothetical protein [Streptomyces venezuelae]
MARTRRARRSRPRERRLRADVAKSTIYRWWKSKAVLVMDGYRAVVEQRMPEPDTGSLAG